MENKNRSWRFLGLRLLLVWSLCCLVLPCVMPQSWGVNLSLDLLEANNSDGGDCTQRIYSHIRDALSSVLQDYFGAPGNLWPWSHLGLRLFYSMWLPLKNIYFGCVSCVLGGTGQITAVLCCLSLHWSATQPGVPFGPVSQFLNCKSRLMVHFGCFWTCVMLFLLRWGEEGMELSW